MSKRLFDLSEEILSLEALLDNEELTDGQRQELVDAWLETQGDVTAKLDNYAALIESLKVYAEQRKFQAERMRALARVDENKAERLRELLKIYFRRHELTKFKTPRFTIGLQANGGKRALTVPPSWEHDPTLASAAFRKVVVALDTDAIRAVVEDFYRKAEAVTAQAKTDVERRELFKRWIESNEDVRRIKELIEGCELQERGQSIRIR
ncbi:MAG TPA: siphovirus Gp157 family protein [Blastocatellia bacterium]|nr:siphovirus Gp157 family protein [Blastocatellia bacterium]